MPTAGRHAGNGIGILLIAITAVAISGPSLDAGPFFSRTHGGLPTRDRTLEPVLLPRMASLALFPRAVRFDIAAQYHQFIFIEVDELYTNMKNVLSQAFGMDDSCRGIEGVMFLRQRLQIKMYLDGYPGNLSWNALVARQNAVRRVATATEFDAPDRQVDDRRGQVFTLG
jgi:hypothetical protein